MPVLPLRTRLVSLVAFLSAVLTALTAAASATGVDRRVQSPAASSTARQIRTLDAADAYMRRNYARLERMRIADGPGPDNVLGYGVDALWRRGIDGAGTTVALLEGWRDPELSRQVRRFDHVYHLPAPRIRTIYPSGPLPRTCPHGMRILGFYGDCQGWGSELALDVVSVHLMAPYARILLVVTPADPDADPAENVAPPEMMRSVQDIAEHHLADVISVSTGTGESTYPDGASEILAQQTGPLAAAAAGIPLVNSSGDCGAAQELALPDSFGCSLTTRFRDASTWDDSPWVTSVGGSTPNLNPRTGTRRGPDALSVLPGAGLSRVYARPAYQNRVASITHSAMRSFPDITMNAFSGTSEAAPLFAGVLALATQANHGRDIGPINPALYAIGPRGARSGIEDVVHGNNTFRSRVGHYVVPGYAARRGFDIASGWGTIAAPRFVPSLVAETRRLGEESAARRASASALARLVLHSLSVTPVPATAGAAPTLTVHASGLLPDYPATLRLDGRLVATVRADARGDLQTTVDLSAAPSTGSHTVTLDSLLISEMTRLQWPPG